MSNTPNLEKVLVAAEHLRGVDQGLSEREYRIQIEVRKDQDGRDVLVESKIRSADDAGSIIDTMHNIGFNTQHLQLVKKEFNPTEAATGFVDRIAKEIMMAGNGEEWLLRAKENRPASESFPIYMPMQAFVDAGVTPDSVERELIDEINEKIAFAVEVKSIKFAKGSNSIKGLLDIKWQNKIPGMTDRALNYYLGTTLPWDVEEFGNSMPSAVGVGDLEVEKTTALKTYLGLNETDEVYDEDREFERGLKRVAIIGISAWVVAAVGLATILNIGKDQRDAAKIQKAVAAEVKANCRVDFTPPNIYSASCDAPYEASGKITFPEATLEQKAAGMMPVRFYVAGENGAGEAKTLEVEDPLVNKYAVNTVFAGEVE